MTKISSASISIPFEKYKETSENEFNRDAKKNMYISAGIPAAALATAMFSKNKNLSTAAALSTPVFVASAINDLYKKKRAKEYFGSSNSRKSEVITNKALDTNTNRAMDIASGIGISDMARRLFHSEEAKKKEFKFSDGL